MNAASSPLRNSVMTLPASTPPPNAQAEALTPQCDSKRAEDAGDESPGRQAQREGTPAWSLPGPRLTESFWGWRWEWLCNEGSWEEKQAVSWLSLGETGKFAIHRTSARSFHRWQCCVGWDITRPFPKQKHGHWSSGYHWDPGLSQQAASFSGYHKGESEKFSHPRIPPMERTFQVGQGWPLQSKTTWSYV